MDAVLIRDSLLYPQAKAPELSDEGSFVNNS